MHTEKSGVGDVEVADDAECIARDQGVPVASSRRTATRSRRSSPAPIRSIAATRRCSISCPSRRARRTTCTSSFAPIVDDGRFFDIKPRFARAIITCLARIGGRPCGIVANNPSQLGGILDNDSADKAAHFIQICDAFNMPLVFLMDVPGFMVGSKVEHEGIIRHGAKMLHVMASATVPKLTVVVRKGYGAGYYVMCGRAYEPDLIVAWPGAEISVMGAEGMVGIAGAKLFGGRRAAARGEEAARRQ